MLVNEEDGQQYVNGIFFQSELSSSVINMRIEYMAIGRKFQKWTKFCQPGISQECEKPVHSVHSYSSSLQMSFHSILKISLIYTDI